MTPGDTRMMNIVHAALRRDLQRASAVLEDPERVSANRLRALGRHLAWFVEFLHAHHIINLMGCPYRRHYRATWTRTPAQTIASTPLPRLGRVA